METVREVEKQGRERVDEDTRQVLMGRKRKMELS